MGLKELFNNDICLAQKHMSNLESYNAKIRESFFIKCFIFASRYAIFFHITGCVMHVEILLKTNTQHVVARNKWSLLW